MNRRPWPLLLTLVLIAFVTWWIFAPHSDQEVTSEIPSDEPAQVATHSKDSPPIVLTQPPVAPAPAPEVPQSPPPAVRGQSAYTTEQRGETVHAEARQEIERVHGMLRDYRTVFGENPVGTNAEIMAALNGGNAKQARLGPPDGQGLNAKGELVDRWGTPYFFHQIDARHMEIHSAGADKVLGTGDDVVMR
jgi:hypothetical protein